MFDIAWSEMVLIGAVALVVIGPKDLPKALRTVGQTVGRVRRMAAEFQGQFNEAMREAELADLKKQVEDVGGSVSSSLNTDFNPIEQPKDFSASGAAAPDEAALKEAEAKLAALGRLSTDTAETLIRRRAAVEADAERQAASLASRGVSPTQAFGTRGTRQTTIGSGVLSGFFDRLFSDIGEGGAKLDNLKDAAGRADSSLKNLAGALGVVSPALARVMAQALRLGQPVAPEVELTERERQVLKMIAGGNSNKMIGRKLGITEGTVKVHVKNLLHKLGLRSRVEAAVWALENERSR